MFDLPGLDELYTPAREGFFLAKLLAKEEVEGVWFYSWERYVGSGLSSGVMAVDDGESGTADVNPAVELNNLEVEIVEGEEPYVWMRLRTMADIGPVYEFEAGGLIDDAVWVEVTNDEPDADGYYEAIRVDYNAVDLEWEDGAECLLLPVNEEELVLAKRYLARFEEKTPEGESLYVVVVGEQYPYATPTLDGIVSTVAQSFGGRKTFVGGVTTDIDVRFAGDTVNSYVRQYLDTSQTDADAVDWRMDVQQASAVGENTRVRLIGSSVSTPSVFKQSALQLRGAPGTLGDFTDAGSFTVAMTSNASNGSATMSMNAPYPGGSIGSDFLYVGVQQGVVDFILTANALGGSSERIFHVFLTDAVPSTFIQIDGQNGVTGTYASVTTRGGVVVGGSASLGVAAGGTGLTTVAVGAVLSGNGTGALVPVAPSTAGGVLTSNGPGVAPSFQPPAGTTPSLATILRYGVR